MPLNLFDAHGEESKEQKKSKKQSSSHVDMHKRCKQIPENTR